MGRWLHLAEILDIHYVFPFPAQTLDIANGLPLIELDTFGPMESASNFGHGLNGGAADAQDSRS